MVSRFEDRNRSQLKEIEHRTERLFASLNNSSGDAEEYSSEGRTSIARSRRKTARRVQQLLDHHLNNKDNNDTELQTKPQRQERAITYEQTTAPKKEPEKTHLQIEDLYERYRNLCEREGVILEKEQEQPEEKFEPSEKKLDSKSDILFSKKEMVQTRELKHDYQPGIKSTENIEEPLFKKTSEHVELVIEKPLERQPVTLDLQSSRRYSPKRSPDRRSPKNLTSSNNYLQTNDFPFESQKGTKSVGTQVDTITKASISSETQTKPALLADQQTQTEYCEIIVEDYSLQCQAEKFQGPEGAEGQEYDDVVNYNIHVPDETSKWRSQNEEVVAEQSLYEPLESSFLENDYYSTNDVGSIQDLVNEFEMDKRRREIGKEKVLEQNKMLRKEKKKKTLSDINQKDNKSLNTSFTNNSIYGNDGFIFAQDGMSRTDQRVRAVAERRSKLEQQKMEAALKKEADLQDIHDRLRRRPKIPLKYYARSISTPPVASPATEGNTKGFGLGGTGASRLSKKKEIKYPGFRTQPVNSEERPDWVDITHKDWSFK